MYKTNISHLRNFIRGVFTDFEILGRFLCLIPMQSTALVKKIQKKRCNAQILVNFFFYIYNKNNLNVKKYILNKIAIVQK